MPTPTASNSTPPAKSCSQKTMEPPLIPDRQPADDSPSILRRIADGVPGAMDALVDRYGGLVWTLARRAFPAHSDAEDVVQDIFVSLWSNAKRFDSRVASESTFVSMIARRRIVDRRRHLSRRPDSAAAGTAASVASLERLAADAASDVDVEVVMSDEVRRVFGALSTLRKEQQRVLLMSIGNGCTHEEIATATGMPVGTVKTHVRRGLVKLRERLGVNQEQNIERVRGEDQT